MREGLIFGGSGQIGAALLARLPADAWRMIAVSRRQRAGTDTVEWRTGDLAAPPRLPARVDVIFSCGPLDAFARWYADADIRAERVVAFGSTSIATKQASADPAERDLAARLAAAERQLFAAAAAHGAEATVLRPTLVYGVGRDANLSRIAALARRFRVFPLPRGACGRRQPVHVDDLADAALACVDRAATHGHAYALPGGETLPYREMVARVLAAMSPPPRLLELPAPLFALALSLARASGRGGGFGEAASARLRADLVFDAGPAQRDFGYAPRLFRPEAAMFAPPPSAR